MNIYFTDIDPNVSARSLPDSLLITAPQQAVILLATALHIAHIFGNRQKVNQKLIIDKVQQQRLVFCSHDAYDYLPLPAKANHPYAIWTRTSDDNFEWLLSYAEMALTEWRLRFVAREQNKRHDCSRTLAYVRDIYGARKLTCRKTSKQYFGEPFTGLTPPALAIKPKEYSKMGLIIDYTSINDAPVEFEYRIEVIKQLIKHCHTHSYTPPGKPPSWL